ncbi:MAG: histidine ammonia-lyase [Elusimicrobia bacterium]|nr:histidine ammonia-lyase [Elusimicrobiota bacterium]
MSQAPFSLGSKANLADLNFVASGTRKVSLGAAAVSRMAASRRVLEKAAASEKPVYGVNTGFGDLATRRISRDQLGALQRNLVLSHACGVGEPLSEEEARAILFLRANEIARGFSGARPELARLMGRLINSGAVPLIPSRGSVGASGDLAPQAHMALLLIGEGQALKNGRKISARVALKAAGAIPAVLQAKEGLSLLNGTQAMQGVGGLSLVRAARVWRAAQIAGAMSLDAMTGTPGPFDEVVHQLKPHAGQILAARQLRGLLRGSKIRESHRENDPRVQDPYCLRCMPQAHGAAWDVLENSRRTVETEMISATDNPLIAGGRLISGGNFHGQALSFAYDAAAMAVTALANISERRLFHLVSGRAPGLKPFLAKNPGLESGWMIAQVAAAALASENKVLAHPASADTIPTSAGQEDFVSMGMTAALKFKQVVWNAAQVIAVELLAAAQGLEAHAPLRSGPGVEKARKLLRAKIPAARGDEVLGPRLERARDLVLEGYFEGILP